VNGLVVLTRPRCWSAGYVHKYVLYVNVLVVLTPRDCLSNSLK